VLELSVGITKAQLEQLFLATVVLLDSGIFNGCFDCRSTSLIIKLVIDRKNKAPLRVPY
jgi:hypothetical protein